MSVGYHTRVLGEANAGGLKEFRVSPLQYYDWVTGPGRKKTPPMKDGSVFHCALHEPERFSKTFVTIPDMPLRSKDDRLAFLNEVFTRTGVPVIDNGGKADELRESVDEQVSKSGAQLVTVETLATLNGMVASLNHKTHAIPRGFVARGTKELELRWTDPDSGIKCKMLADSWDQPVGALTDLKRTDKITAREFKRDIYNREYGFQIAWYRRGLRAHGEDPRYNGLVCGSPSRPHPWAVYQLEDEYLDYCDGIHSMTLLSLAECLATDTWPTLNNGEPVLIQMRTSQS